VGRLRGQAETFLAGDERKALAQFQEEGLQVVDDALFDR